MKCDVCCVSLLYSVDRVDAFCICSKVEIYRGRHRFARIKIWAARRETYILYNDIVICIMNWPPTNEFELWDLVGLYFKTLAKHARWWPISGRNHHAELAAWSLWRSVRWRDWKTVEDDDYWAQESGKHRQCMECECSSLYEDKTTVWTGMQQE